MKQRFAAYIIACFLYITTGGMAFSETLHVTALKLLTGSTSFQAENYSLESAIADYKTSSNLPDPEAGGEYMVLPPEADNRWAAQLSWSLEWPGVYGARSRESQMKISAAEKTLHAQRIERLAEIKDFLLQYIQCRQKLVLLDELNRNNDTIFVLAERAAQGGELTVLDLNKVKLEYANIRGARATLLEEEAEIIGEISKIYGKDCSEIVSEMDCKFPDILLPPEEEILKIKDLAPRVQAANAEAEAARKARKVVSMEALPSISLGYKHAFEDGMHFNGGILGVSIPIFSSRGKGKAAKAQILEKEFLAESAGMEIEAESFQTWKRLKLLKEQIEEITPLVDSGLYNETLLKAYRHGVITLIDYITERNYFTNAALELVNLRYSAAKAQVQLQKYLD